MSPCSLRRGCLAAGVAAALVIPLTCAWASETFPRKPLPCQIQPCLSSSAITDHHKIDSREWRLALLERALQSGKSFDLMEYEPPRPAKAPSSSRRSCVNAVSAVALTPLCTAPTSMRSRVGVTHAVTGEVLATTEIPAVEKPVPTRVRRQRLASVASSAKVRPVHDNASPARVVETVLGDDVPQEQDAALVLDAERRMLIRQLGTTVHHL